MAWGWVVVRKRFFRAGKAEMSVAELDEWNRDYAHDLIAQAAMRRSLRDQMPDVFKELAHRTGLEASRIASYFYRKIHRPYMTDLQLLAAAAEAVKARREAERQLETEINTLAARHNRQARELRARAPRFLAALVAPDMEGVAPREAEEEVAPRRATGSRR